MVIATWNVNSIRARLERLLLWLERCRPDVVCLQELKVENKNFPFSELEDVGYHAAVFGQKTYHGVAILAREPLREITLGLDDGVDDGQSRLIAATVGGVRILSTYAPNGNDPGSEKYAYKKEWFERLCGRLQRREELSSAFLLCGDLNIAPQSRDVGRPEKWEGTVLYNPEMRTVFERILACGLQDLGDLHLPSGTFTWWDYRQLAFPRNDGLRIDHLLASPALAARCVRVMVDREERKGANPSDHVPVMATFDGI